VSVKIVGKLIDAFNTLGVVTESRRFTVNETELKADNRCDI